jgi:hypothetical protein
LNRKAAPDAVHPTRQPWEKRKKKVQVFVLHKRFNMWMLQLPAGAVEDRNAHGEWILLEEVPIGATSSVRQQRCEQVTELGE